MYDIEGLAETLAQMMCGCRCERIGLDPIHPCDLGCDDDLDGCCKSAKRINRGEDGWECVECHLLHGSM